MILSIGSPYKTISFIDKITVQISAEIFKLFTYSDNFHLFTKTPFLQKKKKKNQSMDAVSKDLA